MRKHLSIAMIALFVCGFWLLAATLAEGASQDDGLYGAPVPDDAVYLRWLGEAAPGEIFGYSFSQAHIGPTYVAVSAQLLLGANSGGYYAVLSQDGASPVIVVEPPRSDLSKVYLFLINATSTPVRLIVAGQATEVIGTTPGQTARGRAVNPVAVQLSVVAVGGGSVLGQFDLKLRRGQNLTFFVQKHGVDLVEHRFGSVIAKSE